MSLEQISTGMFILLLLAVTAALFLRHSFYRALMPAPQIARQIENFKAQIAKIIGRK